MLKNEVALQLLPFLIINDTFPTWKQVCLILFLCQTPGRVQVRNLFSGIQLKSSLG